jgi:hypothetical protein
VVAIARRTRPVCLWPGVGCQPSPAPAGSSAAAPRPDPSRTTTTERVGRGTSNTRTVNRSVGTGRFVTAARHRARRSPSTSDTNHDRPPSHRAAATAIREPLIGHVQSQKPWRCSRTSSPSHTLSIFGVHFNACRPSTAPTAGLPAQCWLRHPRRARTDPFGPALVRLVTRRQPALGWARAAGDDDGPGQARWHGPGRTQAGPRTSWPSARDLLVPDALPPAYPCRPRPTGPARARRLGVGGCRPPRSAASRSTVSCRVARAAVVSASRGVITVARK